MSLNGHLQYNKAYWSCSDSTDNVKAGEEPDGLFSLAGKPRAPTCDVAATELGRFKLLLVGTSVPVMLLNK